jgi:hypothetical protein
VEKVYCVEFDQNTRKGGGVREDNICIFTAFGKKYISPKQYLFKILSSFSVIEIANHRFTTENSKNKMAITNIHVYDSHSVLHVNAELSLLLSFGTRQIKCLMHAL